MREVLFNFDALPEASSRYILEECQGEGVYGKVFQAKDTQAGNKKVAIKIQRFTQENAPFIQEEYRILRDFSDHPNLPEFYGIYRNTTEEREEIWFVMELCAGGPVIDLVNGLITRNRRMAEEHIALILKEVVKALIYLHENKVMHRDVRANNILLTKEGDTKLVDFGLSRLLNSTLGKTSTCLGSPSWMAPEVAKTQVDHETEGYDNRADVWSLGITAIELGDGKSPLQDMHPTRAMFQIVRNPPPTLNRPGNWSASFSDFVNECLVKNPEHRPYMVELLEHQFLTEVPENNYYLTQELKILYQEYRKTGRKKRFAEAVVHSNLLKTGQDATMEQMHVEDLSTLEKLNEEAVLRELNNRMAAGQFCTFIGDILLVLNPNEQQDIYGEEQHHTYKFKSRSDNAPHIYSVADSAYQAALHHETSQHILLAGESSSGKTTNYLHIVDHLLYLGQNNNINQERIKNGVKLLHAFIHASTPTNDYSTRCVLHTEITYGSSGKNTGARFEMYQIEKWRVSSTDMDQPNFHILYYFYDGIQATGELNKYQLRKDKRYRYLRIPQDVKSNRPRDTPKQNVKKYKKILDIFKEFEFTSEQIESILNTLAAVINLGEVRFTETPEKKAKIENEESAVNVAQLLKVDQKRFLWALTNYCVVSEETALRKKRSCEEARDARDVLANTLYSRVVQYVVNVVNHKLSYGMAIFGAKHSVKILDFYGFECFKENHFPQFLINCFNEVLQYHYLQRVFGWEALESNEENIPYKPIYYYNNKNALDEMLGKSGMLNCIDEASRQDRGSKYIIERLQNQENVYVNKINGSEFCINHYTGKVTYESKEMADRNRDFLPPEIIGIIRSANDPVIRLFFSNKLNKAGNLCVSFEEQTMQGNDSVSEERNLNRQQYSQTREMRTAAATFKGFTIELLKDLSVGGGAGGTHFVRCVRSDLLGNSRGFHGEVVKQQLRAMAVLETAKTRQKGFPHRISFPEFLKRYKFLAFDFDENVEVTKENCRMLLVRLKMEGWAIGKSKVFLKYYNEEYLSRLYETQVKKVIKIQAMIRAYLVKRRMLKKLELSRKATTSYHEENKTLTEEEAATVVQKAYRNYSVKKMYGMFPTNTDKFNGELVQFIRFFYNKWRTKSIFQVLLQYRAAKYQDLYNLSQQVHLYNQSTTNVLQQCKKVDLERVDSRAQVDTWLGNKKPSVLKLPFRIDEIPYFDTSYMCEPLKTLETSVGKQEESWDAPLQWRETVSSQITSSMLTNNEKLKMSDSFQNHLIELPYSRNPAELVRCISSPTIDSEEEKQDEPNTNYKKVDTDHSEDVSSNFEQNYYVAEKKSRLGKNHVSNINNNTTSANKDFEYIRPHSSTKGHKTKIGYINPIAELETKGRRNNASDDDPPFNFQAMLRKTNFKRDSIKRRDEILEISFKEKHRKNVDGDNANGGDNQEEEKIGNKNKKVGKIEPNESLRNDKVQKDVPNDSSKELKEHKNALRNNNYQEDAPNKCNTEVKKCEPEKSPRSDTEDDVSNESKRGTFKKSSTDKLINKVATNIGTNNTLEEKSAGSNGKESKEKAVVVEFEVLPPTEIVPGFFLEGFIVNL